MADCNSDQGPSQGPSLTPEEALLRYSPSRHYVKAARSAAAEEQVRAMVANQFVTVEYAQLWSPALLPSFGETCRRAQYVNEFHILLCKRRLIIVQRNERHLTFPPFDESLNDAYAERVSEHCILVIVAVASGVHVALVRESADGPAETLHTVFCPTAAPVCRVHHLQKGLYGLCCSNCTVESLAIHLSDVRSSSPELDATLLAGRHGWVRAARDYFSTRQYVQSFFDRYKGFLVMLSRTDLSLWTYRDGTHLELECSLTLSRGTAAVAVVQPPSDCDEDGDPQVAVLITGDGARAPVRLVGAASRNGVGTRALAFGEPRCLPSSVTNTAVSLASACDTSLLLVDQLTSSFVLTTPSEPFCEPFRSSAVVVVSQVFLGAKVCGVAVERDSRSDGGLFAFLVYCADSTVVRISRLPRGQLLQRFFAMSATNGVAALHLLEPEARVDVVLDAALSGLPVSRVSQCLNPLLSPRALASNEVQLSDGAMGILRHTMRSLSSLSRLCSSFQYWHLSDDLACSRTRLQKTCDVLTEALNRGGWLDCPGNVTAKWSSRFAAELSGDHVDSVTAINAQAQLLQTLLAALQHAITIAWLYELLLQNDVAYHLPSRLEDLLWKDDPTVVEAELCLQLLSLKRGTVTEALLQSGHALPQHCRLAASLLSLAQETSFEDVMQFARTHILDLARCDLFPYTIDLLEAHSPAPLPRLLLLVYYYPHHREVSAEMMTIVEQIDSLALLRSTLTTILCDPACDEDLAGVVLDWMESHSLADPRIPVFADMVVERRLNVDPAHTLAGRFFSAARKAATGHLQQAASRFGELARSELSIPLAGRLLAVERAAAAMPSDADRLTQFILLLQQQLASLIDEHLQNGKDLLFTRSTIENDLALLREHCLGENRLFELAGRYKSLGGCSIQLDLLKVHPDAAEFTVANAITGVLTFLTAVGLSATDAVRRVLKEYLGTFQAPLPVYPFVEFLAFDGQSPSTAIHELAAAGMQQPVLFDTFMGLLDGRNSRLFPVGETAKALAQLVAKMDMSVQHICAAHLLECSRSLLEGEQHAVPLSEEEEDVMKEVSDEMRALSQRSHVRA